MGISTEGAERGQRCLITAATILVALLLSGEIALGGERPKSWSQRASEARNEAMRCLAQYDLVGAAAAQSEYAHALAHLQGIDDPQTRWAAAFAHEWSELSQLPCDRQYAYIESLHLLISKGKRVDVDRVARLADLVDALVILEPLRGEPSFTALFGLVEMGDLARASGDPDGAIDSYMTALNGLAATCGADHPTASGILERLAAAYADLEQYDETERWMREALAIYRRGETGEAVYLGGLVRLAAIHLKRGDLTEAEGLLVWTRKLSEKRSVRSDALKGEIRFALAYVLAKQGNYKEAAEMLAFARRHFEKLTDSRTRNLARIEQLSRFLEAHAATESSPSCEFPQPGLLWEEVDGELRLRTPAASEEEGNMPTEALARLEASRDKLRSHLECGELDKVVLLQRERMALIETSPLKNQPLARYEEVLLDEWKGVLAMEPDDRFQYAQVHSCLANGERLLTGSEPEIAAAEECLLAAVAGLEKLGLGTSIHVAFAYRHLSHIRVARGDYPVALTEAERAHETFIALYGPEDPHSLDVVDTIVRLHVELGELDEAESLLRESLPVARRVVRMNSPQYVGLLLSGAKIHVQRGRLAEGEGMCHQAAELASRLLEKSPVLEAECECLVAEILSAHGEFSKADVQFAKTWRLFHQSLEPHRPVRRHLLAGHARTLAALGREQEARECLSLIEAPANDDVMAHSNLK